MENEITIRTKPIGPDVIRLVDDLPRRISSAIISRQLIRFSASIGANYIAACRAKSDADFLNRLRIAEEESDETLSWLEILEEAGFIDSGRIMLLKTKTSAITVSVDASQKTIL